MTMTATQDNNINGHKEEPKSRAKPSRSQPCVYPSSDAPLCNGCRKLDMTFFDPGCIGCLEILKSPSTTIPQIFAIIRQWVPQVQQKVEVLVNEILKRGANINDRDGLTDMTLLHYACKAGANGVGEVAAATKTVGFLLDQGADIHIRCRWTDMAAIHYAAYFDVAPVVELLIKASQGKDINSQCREFEGGSPLHIAATNLCVDVVKLFIEHGADVCLRDDLGRTPLECVPEFPSSDHTPDLRDVIFSMRNLLEKATPTHIVEESPGSSTVTGKAVLRSMGLQVGDRVVVGGAKVGTLRYCGTTQFAQGVWAGVELDEPLGKNNGSLKGVTYFKCPPNHGIFAPINKLSKYGSVSPYHAKSPSRSCPSKNVSHSRVDLSRITSKVETGLRSRHLNTSNGSCCDFSVGDRVLVSGHRKGTVRFAGETEFALGFWYGIELDKPQGKNDGSVSGVQYFECPAGHGVFAPPHRLSRIMKRFEDESSDQDSTELSMSKSSTDGDTMGISSPSSPRSVGSGRSFTRRNHVQSPLNNSMMSPGVKSGCWLTVGVNVFVNNEIGAVRYIGPVEFADGTWLGVELRTPKGRNDGSVQGKRYFTCRPNYGLLVRPNRVTVRGINGAKLLESAVA